MLTFLIVLLAIIYIIIGSTVGALCALMFMVSDGSYLLDYVRDLYYKGETDTERASEIVGTGIALAIISIIWPAYLVWAYCVTGSDKN